MPPLFPITLALYAVAFTLYCVDVGQPRKQPPSRYALLGARGLLLLAFAIQAGDIGWLCLHGQSPASSTRDATFFASWLMVGVYLLLSLRSQITVVATLVLPVVMVLEGVARLLPGEAPRAASVLGALHIFSATLGLAIFAVAAGTSVIYLMTERQLKRHHLGQLGRRGPALETMDSLNRLCVIIGFPVFTLALVSGAIWIARLPHQAAANPVLALILRPQYALSVMAWLIYAGLLITRVTAGMRGRRAAKLTLCGFGLALSVLLVYFLRGAAAP